jgi:hypothetical protein
MLNVGIVTALVLGIAHVILKALALARFRATTL